jgi:hypothetical protein
MNDLDKLAESEKLKKRAGELFKVRFQVQSRFIQLSLSGWTLSCGL